MKSIKQILMEKQEYKKWFCAPSDVSRAELLHRAIRNARKRATEKTRYSGYYKLKRKQLTAIVNKNEPYTSE